MTLLSSSARGSKPISDTSILLRPRFEADLLIYWFAHLTGLTLDCQSNLVLFRSYTWKPIKLGSVPVLHLKASQTWFCSGLTLESQSNLVLFHHMSTYLDLPSAASAYSFSSGLTLNCHCFFIYLFTWTYPWLPVWLRFDFFMYIYWVGLTTLMPFWLGFGIVWKLWSVWIPSFSPKVFLKLLSGARPFSLCIPISNKKTYTWCNVSCNVWLSI